MNNSSQENSNQALVDALKYTSDIIITLTEKINSQDNKISFFEKNIIDQKNIISKNQNDILELNKKIFTLEKSVLLLISSKNNNGNTTRIDKSKDNIEFEFLSQTLQELGSNPENLEVIESLFGNDSNIKNLLDQDKLDLETLNNTICNTTLVSDVTSFNIEDIEKLKKQKATNLVENLIKKKQELETKINGINGNGLDNNLNTVQTVQTNNSNVLIEQNKTDTKSNQDLNAVRRKKNFARRF